MKTDCFAYRSPTSSKPFPTCSALKTLECEFNDNCPFYKEYNEERKDLWKYNHSKSLEEILQKYAGKHDDYNKTVEGLKCCIKMSCQKCPYNEPENDEGGICHEMLLRDAIAGLS